MRVIFDASDPVGKVEEEEVVEEPEDLIDLSYLRSECFPFDSNSIFLLTISLRGIPARSNCHRRQRNCTLTRWLFLLKE